MGVSINNLVPFINGCRGIAVLKTVVEAGLNMAAVVTPPSFNEAAFDGLPDDLKAILEAAVLSVSADLLAEYTARNNAALHVLVDEHHVEVRPLPADVLKELKAISYAVTSEIVDDDPLSQRIYDSYQQYRKGVIEYHEISERAYINARAD